MDTQAGGARAVMKRVDDADACCAASTALS